MIPLCGIMSVMDGISLQILEASSLFAELCLQWMASVCKYLKQDKSLLHGQWIAFLGSNSIIRNSIPLVDDSVLYNFL